MAEQPIISISGLRGIAGENLTASVAADYARAFGAFLKDTQAGKSENLSVCVGRDPRPSGAMLKEAVTEGLRSVGVDVIDLGIVTTPGVGVMTLELSADGGVVVTASHNPAQYNGIKLLLRNAIAPPPDAAGKIKRYFLDKSLATRGPSHYGKVTSDPRTDDVHIAKVLAIVEKYKIGEKRFKVALDSINGAGGRVTKKLLAELGCMVVAINDQPTGIFAHLPEPTAENVTALCEVVTAEKAHVGFALDPDGDRLAVVDEKGVYVGEEYTLALAAKYIFGRKTGRAATNLSTSRMIDDIASRAGGRVIRTPVGEAHVAAAMLEHSCVIGGEGNGGVIDLRVSPIRDSLVGAALILQLMAETGKKVSRLVTEIGRYHMYKTKFVARPSQVERILTRARNIFAHAKLDTTDGCRFDFEDGWVHLRASNTEPVMRVIAEAKEQAATQKYVDKVLNIRRQISD